MQAYLDTVRNAVTTGGISKTELAQEADLHRNSLAEIGERWNPRVKTLEALCAAVERIKARRA